MLHAIDFSFLWYPPLSPLHQLDNYSHVAVFDQDHDFTPKRNTAIFVLCYYYCLFNTKHWNPIRIVIFPFPKVIIGTIVDEESRPVDTTSLKIFAGYEMIIIMKIHKATTLKMAVFSLSLVQCVSIL